MDTIEVKEEKRSWQDRRKNDVDKRFLIVLKDLLFQHIFAIIGGLVILLGAWWAVGSQLKTNTDNIKKNTESITVLDDRMMNAEKAEIQLRADDKLVIQRLDAISGDIKDLKSTLTTLDGKLNERMTRMSDKTQSQFEELKKILYKPVVDNNTTHFDIVDLSTGNMASK